MEQEPISHRATAVEARLSALTALCRAAGAEELSSEAEELTTRMAEGRFHVACIGQFKRGKSTLINALIGRRLLPAGVVPLTAVVTVVRYGSELAARVRMADGTWTAIDPDTLVEYVSEERNPENRRGVSAIEVFVPSPLLQGGMCLVDTPGLGSVFEQATAATHAFVPHIDAALVVLGADPPIGGEEAALVEDVARQVDDIIIVLNKADRLSDIERQEAARFTERVLEGRLSRPVGQLLQVSATDRLAGSGPARDFAALEETLERLAGRSGASLVQAAEARWVEILAARLEHDLSERSNALERPLVESDERLARLRGQVADADRSLSDLPHLLTAEEQRLARAFAADRERFLAGSVPAVRAELAAATDTLAAAGPALRRRAFARALELAERSIDRWRTEEQPRAEALYRQAMLRFVELANGFLDRLAASAGLVHVPRAMPPETGLRALSGFYPIGMMHLAGGGPGRWVLDLVGSRARRRAAVSRDAATYLGHLLEVNSARIQNDFIDRVRESRRRLEAEVRTRLRHVVASAERAADQARSIQARGADAVAAELARLTDLASQVTEIRQMPAHEQGETQ